MSAHRLIRYPFGGTSIVPFDAYGRSLLRHRWHVLRGFPPFLVLPLSGKAPTESLNNLGFRWVNRPAPVTPLPGGKARLRAAASDPCGSFLSLHFQNDGFRANAMMRGLPYPLQRGHCTSRRAARMDPRRKLLLMCHRRLPLARREHSPLK
jgi:hypothetical protein